jgi:hypothetical protein
MRETDINILMYFITRTGMYVGKESKETITSFIIGYEVGANGNVRISEHISQLLSSEFNIEMQADGWLGQIERFADKNKKTWTSSFKEIVLKYFYRTQNFQIDSEFKKALKTRIESKIDQLNLDWVASGFENWINEWVGLVDLKEKNFKVIWSESEFEIIKAIDIEINEIRKSENQLTKKLIELREKYKE